MPYSKLHLVPILKGAVDPKKGIIFRTYYIRPERLQSMIKKLHETPTKSYIVKIPFLNEIEKAVQTDNILSLYDLVKKFPEGEKAWKVIQEQHRFLSVSTHVAEHRQALLQSVYHYVLTQDKTAVTHMQKVLPNAAYTWKLQITANEKVNTPKLKRKKVRESITVVNTQEDFLKLHKSIVQQRDTTSLVTQKDLDHGVIVKYSKKLYKVKAGDIVGRQLSTLLNFLNTNPAKVKTVVASLITRTTLRDKYCIVGNTLLKFQMYQQEKEFWAELLTKLIHDISSGECSAYHREMLQFYIPLLIALDEKRGKLVLQALSDDIYNLGISVLDQKHSEGEPDTFPELFQVASIITRRLPLTDIQNWTDFLLGAAITTLDSHQAYNFLCKHTDISARSVLLSLYGDFSWKWCLGQILFAKLYNLHFIPYKEIALYTSQDTYSPSIATKIFLPYLEKQASELALSVKELKRSTEKIQSRTLTVYKPIPQSPTLHLLVHLNPVETFYLTEPDAAHIQVKLDKESLLHIDEEKQRLLAVNCIRYLQ